MKAGAGSGGQRARRLVAPRASLEPFRLTEPFLVDALGARALECALERGLVSLLKGEPGLGCAAIAARLGAPETGCHAWLGLLGAAGVVQRSATGAGFELTSRFTRALAYRDLMESRLEFCRLVAGDVHELLPELLLDPGAFMERSRVFDLFRYDRCFEATPENRAATRRWVAITTGLTRFEAPVCIEALARERFHRVMDIGGNSGELVRQMCARWSDLRATVVDLPLVCEVARAHLAGTPEAARIECVPADALSDPLPPEHDLVVFKSVLHDWPDREALHLLDRAIDALRPGGTLLVFERGKIPVGTAPLPYSMVPNLLFLHYLRGPSLYLERLKARGFTDLECLEVDLEMRFDLVIGRKPRSAG